MSKKMSVKESKVKAEATTEQKESLNSITESLAYDDLSLEGDAESMETVRELLMGKNIKRLNRRIDQLAANLLQEFKTMSERQSGSEKDLRGKLEQSLKRAEDLERKMGEKFKAFKQDMRTRDKDAGAEQRKFATEIKSEIKHEAKDIDKKLEARAKLEDERNGKTGETLKSLEARLLKLESEKLNKEAFAAALSVLSQNIMHDGEQ